MKKSIITILLCGMLLCTLPTATAANGLHNFKQTVTYRTGQFTDVAADAWYADNVKAVYEIGLMKGTGETIFNPGGNITYAEVYALGSRLHSVYNGKDAAFAQGTPWYQVYLDYTENTVNAAQNKVPLNLYQQYTKPATRQAFVDMIYGYIYDIPKQSINAIDRNSIPDFPYQANNSSEQNARVEKTAELYAAGILTGSDPYGNFQPESNITRAEVATIVTRIIDPSLRKTFQLEKKTEAAGKQTTAPRETLLKIVEYNLSAVENMSKTFEFLETVIESCQLYERYPSKKGKDIVDKAFETMTLTTTVHWWYFTKARDLCEPYAELTELYGYYDEIVNILSETFAQPKTAQGASEILKMYGKVVDIGNHKLTPCINKLVGIS